MAGQESRAAYTPAPWNAVTVGLVEGRPLTQVMASGRWIADAVYTTDDVSEAEANARLIAAAPDLLAALESAIDQIEGVGVEDWAGAEGLDFSDARAAIAKARGN